MVDVHCTRRLRCGRCAATLPITVVAIVASHWHTHTHTHRCLAHVRIWRPRMCFSVRHSKLSSCQVQFASASTAPVRPQPRPMPSTVSQFPASHPHVRCAFSFATIASIPSRNTSALSLAISTSISVGNRVHTLFARPYRNGINRCCYSTGLSVRLYTIAIAHTAAATAICRQSPSHGRLGCRLLWPAGGGGAGRRRYYVFANRLIASPAESASRCANAMHHDALGLGQAHTHTCQSEQIVCHRLA